MINGLYALINGRLRGVSKVIWKDVSQTALSLINRTSDLSWTDLDLSARTSATAKFAILLLELKTDTIGTGDYCYFSVRKNGTTPGRPPQLVLDKAGITTGVYHYEQVIIGLDSEQVIEYEVLIGTGWQVDIKITVLGYIE